MFYTRKIILHVFFRCKWKFPSLGITVLAGTRRRLINRQAQLSRGTETPIRTSNPWKILIGHFHHSWHSNPHPWRVSDKQVHSSIVLNATVSRTYVYGNVYLVHMLYGNLYLVQYMLYGNSIHFVLTQIHWKTVNIWSGWHSYCGKCDKTCLFNWRISLSNLFHWNKFSSIGTYIPQLIMTINGPKHFREF